MEQSPDKQETTKQTGGRRDFLKNVAMGGVALGVTAAVSGKALAAPLPEAAKRSAKPDPFVNDQIIDFHAHMVPPDTAGAAPYMMDMPALLRDQQEAGVDISVISDPMFSPASRVPSVEAMRAWNKWAGETAKRSEGRLVGLACSFPWAGKEYTQETRRALKEDGLRGIMVNSSSHGEYLDSPKCYPLYDLATELDVPIFEHPPYAGMSGGNMDQFRLHEMVGRPCDTTLTLARMILFGVLEKYPTLKVVAAHMGGGILMLPGRLNFGYELRKDAFFGPWEPDVLSKPPAHYISMLYVDTMGFHPPAVQLAIATVGIDHVLLGSDHPPVTIALKRSVETTMGLPISVADKRKVLGGNAARLLKLT